MGTQIQTTAEGLTLDCNPPVAWGWSDVAEIVAFKRDLVTTDLVCVGFRLHGTNNLIEIDEEMPGFDAALASVASRFPLRADWWHAVAFPAFATNMTTLWSIAS